MIQRRCSVVVLLLALIAQAACDSTPKRPEAGSTRQPADDGDADVVESVTVPKLCLDQMAEFFDREQLLLADRVVIDASSDPFFPAVIPVSDAETVEKVQAVDARRRISILRLRNKTGQENIEAVLPRVRVGDGFLIVATREILVRFHQKVRAARPIYFDLGAQGRVVYSDSHRGETLRRTSLGLHLEVRKADGGYMFASRAE